MRITYVCYEDLTEGRGGVGHVVEVVMALLRQGHSVHLIVPAARGGTMPNLGDVRVTLVPLIPIRIVNWIGFYILSAVYLILTSLKNRPDLVYEREMAYNLFLPLSVALLGIPRVVEINGLIHDERAVVGAGLFELELLSFTQRLSLTRADAVVVVTEGFQHALLATYPLEPGRVHVVANGTNPEVFHPKDEVECRKRVNLPQDIPIVGFVGSCYAYHDIPILIQAAPAVLKAFPETQFVVVGDGAMRNPWIVEVAQNSLDSSFLFPGRAPYHLVPSYINAFTVCVAPYIAVEDQKIGSPIKVYDYLACGKAVVGNGIAEIYTLLESHHAGLAVQPSNPDAMAEAIIAYLADHDLRKQTGSVGYHLIRHRHTWDHVAGKLVDIGKQYI